ncbi:MAG: HEPN domain-containing protein [Candidatus Methanoplasma sp.]|jgi:HEPN domain-containing protein|nr:HEPN domain-containing protein [Candidatus Methanoplasma sp.]
MAQFNDVQALRQRAIEDLTVAEIILDSNDELLAQICFHLQQFLEKMMKARLQEHNVAYTKTRDLVALLKLFPESNLCDEHQAFVSFMSLFAVESRYGSYVMPPWDGQELTTKSKEFVSLIDSFWD